MYSAISVQVLTSNAIAAFALNLAVYLLIGKTSALTMNIAGERFLLSLVALARGFQDQPGPCACSSARRPR